MTIEYNCLGGLEGEAELGACGDADEEGRQGRL